MEQDRAMICFKCDNEEFREEYGNVTQEYKGRTFEVPTHVMACTKCGWRTIGLNQADELLANTKNVYSFEVWWEKDYSHMNPDNYSGSLAKNFIGVTKAVAKAAWLADRQPKPLSASSDIDRTQPPENVSGSVEGADPKL